MAGNCINHPETIQPDSHSPGSPLPRANLHNSIGYLPDGAPMNAAGNALNHPETMQPDMHTPGSPLPSSVYAADVGYLVDGTDLATAGNNSVKVLSSTRVFPFLLLFQHQRGTWKLELLTLSAQTAWACQGVCVCVCVEYKTK